jgi:hypothetical protein
MAQEFGSFFCHPSFCQTKRLHLRGGFDPHPLAPF